MSKYKIECGTVANWLFRAILSSDLASVPQLPPSSRRYSASSFLKLSPKNLNFQQPQYVDKLSKSIEKKIHKGYREYEKERGVTCNYKKFFLVARDSSNEDIGILIAYAAFVEVCIAELWVDPKWCGIGIGRELIHMLEERFKGKGYNNINLVTNQFQAPEFYKKCGFEVEFMRVNKHNPKLTKTFFIKYFDDKGQTKGILK